MFRYILISAVVAISLNAQILITKQYIKETPPNAKNSAAFMSIENQDSKDIELLSDSSNVSKVSELHTHITQDGMKQMIQIPSIKIPANSKVDFKPGGLHIMLIGLNKDINNQNVDLNLTFNDGKTYELKAIPVKKVVPIKMH